MSNELLVTSASVLESQKRELLDFFTPLLKGKRVHFFDVPVHTNTGDSLIMAGTLQLLEELSVTIVSWNSIYHSGIFGANRNSAKVKLGDVIVCQGGGNFGDIYERHQDLRKQTVDLYPQNQVIVFPQSVHFNRQQNLEKDLSFFGEVQNFMICVRDEFSYKTLKDNNIENTFLVPDIATCLVDVLKPSDSKASKSTLNFLRVDVETTRSDETVDSLDWIDINPSFDEKVMYYLRKIAAKSHMLGSSSLWWAIYKRTHRNLIKNATSVFSKYEVIRTDRLHGMILSQLVGRKCERLDNSYGKLIRYASKWFLPTKGTHE